MDQWHSVETATCEAPSYLVALYCDAKLATLKTGSVSASSVVRAYHERFGTFLAQLMKDMDITWEAALIHNFGRSLHGARLPVPGASYGTQSFPNGVVGKIRPGALQGRHHAGNVSTIPPLSFVIA